MPAKVQTKARANRVKLFKSFYQTSKPRFRCYHGGRLPPKTFEGLWKHKKFYTKDIKVGHTAKPSKKITLPDKKQTARPQARGKRGPLRATVVGKKKPDQSPKTQENGDLVKGEGIRTGKGTG